MENSGDAEAVFRELKVAIDQAFSIRPDMNRFTLSHGAGGKVLATYSNEYED
jgi:hypothetical protein